MGEITSYRDLDVWQQARILIKVIYQLSKKFPKEEQFGLNNEAEVLKILDHVMRCKKLLNGFINYYQKLSNNQQRSTK